MLVGIYTSKIDNKFREYWRCGLGVVEIFLNFLTKQVNLHCYFTIYVPVIPLRFIHAIEKYKRSFYICCKL
jgi:hypothetical protein